MTEQADAQLRRPLWRRLLRYAGFTLGGLLGLLLALLATLIAINWNDEPLTPEAQAWLTEPPNPVADADNAWLAMIALGVEKQPGTTVGRQIVKRLKEEPNPSDVAENQLSQFGPVWQSSRIDTSLCNVRQNGPDVLPRILAKQAELKLLVSQQQAALARYYAAIALPGFHEEDAPSMTAFLPYAPGSKAACLARIDLALRLLAGDAAAETRFAQHMRYWLRAAEASPALLGAMIANAQIQSDQAVLRGLLEPRNKSATRILQTLRTDLQRFSALDETALRPRLLAGELRLTNGLLVQAMDTGGLSWFERWQYHLLNKQQASLNYQQFLMSHPEATKDRCDYFHWHYAYNPFGKILACVAAPNYPPYFKRIRTTQESIAELLAQNH